MVKRIIGHVVTDSNRNLALRRRGWSPFTPESHIYSAGCSEEIDNTVRNEEPPNRLTHVIEVVGEEPDENLPSIGRLYLSAKDKARHEDNNFNEDEFDRREKLSYDSSEII